MTCLNECGFDEKTVVLRLFVTGRESEREESEIFKRSWQIEQIGAFRKWLVRNRSKLRVEDAGTTR